MASCFTPELVQEKIQSIKLFSRPTKGVPEIKHMGHSKIPGVPREYMVVGRPLQMNPLQVVRGYATFASSCGSRFQRWRRGAAMDATGVGPVRAARLPFPTLPLVLQTKKDSRFVRALFWAAATNAARKRRCSSELTEEWRPSATCRRARVTSWRALTSPRRRMFAISRYE